MAHYLAIKIKEQLKKVIQCNIESSWYTSLTNFPSNTLGRISLGCMTSSAIGLWKLIGQSPSSSDCSRSSTSLQETENMWDTWWSWRSWWSAPHGNQLHSSPQSGWWWHCKRWLSPTPSYQRNSWASCCEYPRNDGMSFHTAWSTASGVTMAHLPDHMTRNNACSSSLNDLQRNGGHNARAQTIPYTSKISSSVQRTSIFKQCIENA